MSVDYSKEIPIIAARGSLAEIDEAIARPIDEKPTKKWFGAIAVTLLLISWGAVSLVISIYYGTGMWGNDNPVFWGFPIVNFVFWVGIGHAGTLISAILFLFRQTWRNAIARFAEAMTIFAVLTAGLFPLIHVGRLWLGGYLLPYPNERLLWVNFRSPLEWDVFAVSTYLTVSFVFWYVGLIPDFATLRDRTKNQLKKIIYSIVSLGWRHSNRHWQHYERMYLLLAGLATPLVLSVHTIVSFDFAVAIIPGWHSTIFPPYFVAGAIFSGFAMVITVLTVVRKVFDLEHLITINHLEKINKVLMATGLMVGYAYAMEFFIAWYSGNPFEQFVFINRATGPYFWAYWIMVTCNAFIPQLFWFKKMRRSIPVMFVVSIFVNIGMWFERYVIVVTSLHRDFLPSSWGMFYPTIIDFGILVGSFGLFFFFVLLFAKSMPVISMAEMKAISPGAQVMPTGGNSHE